MLKNLQSMILYVQLHYFNSKLTASGSVAMKLGRRRILTAEYREILNDVSVSAVDEPKKYAKMRTDLLKELRSKTVLLQNEDKSIFTSNKFSKIFSYLIIFFLSFISLVVHTVISFLRQIKTLKFQRDGWRDGWRNGRRLIHVSVV